MPSIILLILIATASYGTGLLILRPFRIEVRRGIEEITLAFALGSAVLGFSVTLMTMFHLVSFIPLAVLTGLFILSGSAGFILRKRLVLTEDNGSEEKIAWWEICIGVFICAYMVLAAVSCFTPLTRPDSLLYHLGAPKIFLANGGMTFLPTVWQANTPLFTEMYFLLGLALDGETLARLLGLLFSGLLLASTWCLAARLYGRKAGSLAVLIIIAIPEIYYQASTAYVDVATAAWLTLAAYALARYSTRQNTAAALMTGIFAGLAAASKLPAALGVIFAAAAVAVLTLKPKNTSRLLINSGAAALAGFLAASPWYLKNLIFAGNPVWPFAWSIFGGQYLTEEVVWTLQRELSSFGGPKTLSAFVRFPLLLLHNFSPLLVLPILFLPFTSKRRAGLFLVSAAVLFSGISFWINTQDRFILVVGALLAAACGSVFNLGNWKRHMLLAVLILAAAFAAYRFIRHPVTHFRKEATAFGNLEAYLEEKLPEYRDYMEMNRSLPENACIMLLAESPYYLDRKWLLAYPGGQAYVDFDSLPATEGLIARLREVGVTHFYINDDSRHVSVRPQTRALRERILRLESEGKLRVIFRRNGAVLFEILF